MKKSLKKSEKPVLIQVRVSPALYEKLRQQAMNEHRSLSSHASFLLERGVSDPVTENALSLRHDVRFA